MNKWKWIMRHIWALWCMGINQETARSMPAWQRHPLLPNTLTTTITHDHLQPPDTPRTTNNHLPPLNTPRTTYHLPPPNTHETTHNHNHLQPPNTPRTTNNHLQTQNHLPPNTSTTTQDQSQRPESDSSCFVAFIVPTQDAGHTQPNQPIHVQL